MNKETSENTIQKIAAIVSYFDRYTSENLKVSDDNGNNLNEIEFLSMNGAEEAIGEIYDKIAKKDYTPAENCKVRYKSADK